MNQLIKVDRGYAPGVALVTIDRADKRNALNRETVEQLQRAFESMATDNSIRVVVLTGAGTVFSAGADLEALQGLQTASREDNVADSESLAKLLEILFLYPKVIIARVNGHAIAGGAGLMAACDYAIASDAARFGFTEVRIGFVPAIVMHFVSRQIGGRELRDLLLSGRLIDAATAVDMGLINEAVPIEELDMLVDRIAADFVSQTSPQAIAHTKKLLASLPLLSLSDAMDLAIRANADARATDDCKEGISAFLEKRKASWKGEG